MGAYQWALHSHLMLTHTTLKSASGKCSYEFTNEATVRLPCVWSCVGGGMGKVRTPMHKMEPESSISLNRRQVK